MFNISGATKFGLNVRKPPAVAGAQVAGMFGDDDEDDGNAIQAGDPVKAQLELQRRRAEEQMKSERLPFFVSSFFSSRGFLQSMKPSWWDRTPPLWNMTRYMINSR